MPLNLNDLEDAKAFQEAFVKPMIDAVREELRPLILQNRRQDLRIRKLERNQKKALAGYAGIVAILTAVVTMAIEYGKEHFLGKH